MDGRLKTPKLGVGGRMIALLAKTEEAINEIGNYFKTLKDGSAHMESWGPRRSGFDSTKEVTEERSRPLPVRANQNLHVIEHPLTLRIIVDLHHRYPLLGAKLRDKYHRR
jgi:hypothetical protein